MIELKRSNPDFKGFYWLTSILKKDDLRFHLTHIQIKDNKACLTDSKRLHYLTTALDYEDGYYAILKRTKAIICLSRADDSGFEYPNIEDLIAINAVKETFSINGLDESKEENSDHASQVTTLIIRQMDDEITVNFGFVLDALTCEDQFDIFVGDKDQPIKFKSENKVAVIMPIRMKIT